MPKHNKGSYTSPTRQALHEVKKFVSDMNRQLKTAEALLDAALLAIDGERSPEKIAIMVEEGLDRVTDAMCMMGQWHDRQARAY
jgi:hypothetical protein